LGKFEGVLLISDFDDTLYGSDLRVSEENRRAIEYLIGNGGLFSVATGRSWRTFESKVNLFPMNAPAVLSNGAAIFDFAANRSLEESFLPDRAIRDCEQLASQFPTLAFETYFGEDAYVFNPNLVTESHMRKVGMDYIERPLSEIPQPWIKLIFEADNPVLLQVQDYVRRHWGEHYEVIFSNRYLLELTGKGSTKGGAVLRLAARMGIGTDHLYCIGDNQNDIPMIEAAKIGFCPSNAASEVKALGARVVGSCDEHCVRDVIEIIDAMY
jgi:Cof subfamily protein (haloacid dehalogenase superfamily)